MRSIFFIVAMFLSIALVACAKDDDSISKVPAAVKSSFVEQFPNVDVVDWDKEGKYYVADFMFTYNNSVTKFETDAWYEANGSWRMTVVDVSFFDLPQPVQNTFSGSEYGNWKMDDVDIVERRGETTLYVIEVESGNSNKDLYYNESGLLLDVKNASNDDFRDLL